MAVEKVFLMVDMKAAKMVYLSDALSVDQWDFELVLEKVETSGAE